MKKQLAVLLLSTLPLRASLDNSDTVAVQAQTVTQQIQHSDTLAQWGSQLAKMKDQLEEAKKYVDLATQMKNVMGNPASALSLLNNEVIGGPKVGELGKTFSELAKSGNAASSLASDIKGLYSPIEFQNPIQGIDSFAKFSAVENAFQNLSDVLTKSEQEADQISRQIDEINKRAASTEAEQRQKQADLQALSVKMADAQKRVDDAQKKLEAQKTLNDSMANKADQAFIHAWYESDKKSNQGLRRLRLIQP